MGSGGGDELNITGLREPLGCCVPMSRMSLGVSVQTETGPFSMMVKRVRVRVNSDAASKAHGHGIKCPMVKRRLRPLSLMVCQPTRHPAATRVSKHARVPHVTVVLVLPLHKV